MPAGISLERLHNVIQAAMGWRQEHLCERVCPPENCGGPTGYLDFLAIVLDPRHPERRWMLDLVDGRFDPEVFDLDRAERELAWV